MNPKGSPGGLTFRRMAFELWAEKGFVNGAIPFISKQLVDKKTNLVTDDMVKEKVFANDSYKDWHDFKKAMLQKRVDQIPNLKPVSFTYRSANFTNADAAKIDELMKDAVNADSLTIRGIRAAGYNSSVHRLKMAIFNAYLRQTDDFRTSIFETKSS